MTAARLWIPDRVRNDDGLESAEARRRFSLSRSDGEVAARSADGGAMAALPSRPLHHALRARSPSPRLRRREDWPQATDRGHWQTRGVC